MARPMTYRAVCVMARAVRPHIEIQVVTLVGATPKVRPVAGGQAELGVAGQQLRSGHHQRLLHSEELRRVEQSF